MNNNQLDRIINIIKKTGDNAIVLDRASDEAVAILSLDRYENLLDIDSYNDECNCDCGEDCDCSGECDCIDEPEIDPNSLEVDAGDEISFFNEDKAVETPVVPDETFDPIPEETAMMEDLIPVSEPKSVAEIISQNPISSVISEENLADVPDDGEVEEERFYLEPVE